MVVKMLSGMAELGIFNMYADDPIKEAIPLNNTNRLNGIEKYHDSLIWDQIVRSTNALPLIIHGQAHLSCGWRSLTSVFRVGCNLLTYSAAEVQSVRQMFSQ